MTSPYLNRPSRNPLHPSPPTSSSCYSNSRGHYNTNKKHSNTDNDLGRLTTKPQALFRRRVGLEFETRPTRALTNDHSLGAGRFGVNFARSKVDVDPVCGIGVGRGYLFYIVVAGIHVDK